MIAPQAARNRRLILTSPSRTNSKRHKNSAKRAAGRSPSNSWMPALSSMHAATVSPASFSIVGDLPERGHSEEVCILRHRVHMAVAVVQENDHPSRLFEKMSIRLLLISAFTSPMISMFHAIAIRKLSKRALNSSGLCQWRPYPAFSTRTGPPRQSLLNVRLSMKSRLITGSSAPFTMASGTGEISTYRHTA